MNLSGKGADPDGDEDDVAVKSLEDIALTVDLARVDLVEQRHHDERVEDHREMLSRLRVQTRLPPVVDIQQQLAYNTQGWQILRLWEKSKKYFTSKKNHDFY